EIFGYAYSPTITTYSIIISITTNTISLLPASPPILPIPLPIASPPLQADYGFVDSVEAEIRRRRAEDIGYGIRDTWIDPRDVAEDEALTTLEGVNTRVTEFAAVQEQDTQDIYGVMEDTQ
nr:hypothetical protein [Tanacetum cinerariifolium]